MNLVPPALSESEAWTLEALLAWIRRADSEVGARRATGDGSVDVALRRFADGLFLLSNDGALGAVIPGLEFRARGRALALSEPLEAEPDGRPVRIEIDRVRTGFTRNWPAFLARRWRLRSLAYSRFVESVVEHAYGREADAVLRLDEPEAVRRFLATVSRRVFEAPYETYSRYLEPSSPFRSGDETLDRILEGDGGNCAEKTMALHFLAHAYGIEAEVVLGGEEASGKFPFRALRSILDERAFHSEVTRDAQRYWQHFALVCPLGGDSGRDVFCDVAGSNIPYLFLDGADAARYLDSNARQPLRVIITLEPIDVYYHRLRDRQDLPLDLCYSMETFIDAIDVIHTVDNELGLFHAGDTWVGVVAYQGRRERRRLLAEYERFVARGGLDRQTDVCMVTDLIRGQHPLLDRFLAAYPTQAQKIRAAEARLRERIRGVNPKSTVEFVIMRLQNRANPP